VCCVRRIFVRSCVIAQLFRPTRLFLLVGKKRSCVKYATPFSVAHKCLNGKVRTRPLPRLWGIIVPSYSESNIRYGVTSQKNLIFRKIAVRTSSVSLSLPQLEFIRTLRSGLIYVLRNIDQKSLVTMLHPVSSKWKINGCGISVYTQTRSQTRHVCCVSNILPT